MNDEADCGCLTLRPCKFLTRVFISVILFLSLHESAVVTYTSIQKLQSSPISKGGTRHTIRLITKKTKNERDESLWDSYAKNTDKKFVERLRKKRKAAHVHISHTNRRDVRLLSKTGFFLEVLPSGKVGGNVNKTVYTKMELQVITPHVKRIKSIATGRYVAINKFGRVVTKDTADRDTFFYEELSEHYKHMYSSIRYPKSNSRLSWYLGLKRKHGPKRNSQGRAKRASRTLPGDLATHFTVLYETTR